MNRPSQTRQRWTPARPQRQKPAAPSHQQHETEDDRELWEQAGAAARRIIRRFNLPDTVENWRCLRQDIADTLLPLD